jgi:cysteine synthase A
LRHPLDIVTSDAFSIEKRNHMKALGANLTIIESKSGGMDEKLTRDMIAAAVRIRYDKGGFLTDQLNNTDVLSRYRGMGDEIWRQTDGSIDAFVQVVGTGGSIRGVAERLVECNPDVQIVAIEPTESPVLSGGEQGAHKIEGMGAGFVVPLWKPELITQILTVSTGEAMAMSRLLATEEGVFAGTSTGCNLVAALKVAKELGQGRTVVTVAVDSGMKYLSTALYNGVNN